MLILFWIAVLLLFLSTGSMPVGETMRKTLIKEITALLKDEWMTEYELRDKLIERGYRISPWRFNTFMTALVEQGAVDSWTTSGQIGDMPIRMRWFRPVPSLAAI